MYSIILLLQGAYLQKFYFHLSLYTWFLLLTSSLLFDNHYSLFYVFVFVWLVNFIYVLE